MHRVYKATKPLCVIRVHLKWLATCCVHASVVHARTHTHTWMCHDDTKWKALFDPALIPSGRLLP